MPMLKYSKSRLSRRMIKAIKQPPVDPKLIKLQFQRQRQASSDHIFADVKSNKTSERKSRKKIDFDVKSSQFKLAKRDSFAASDSDTDMSLGKWSPETSTLRQVDTKLESVQTQ